MEIREGLLYAKSHEWVKEEGDVVTIGLTDYAQSELGDLVFVIFRKREIAYPLVRHLVMLSL